MKLCVVYATINQQARLRSSEPLLSFKLISQHPTVVVRAYKPSVVAKSFTVSSYRAGKPRIYESHQD